MLHIEELYWFTCILNLKQSYNPIFKLFAFNLIAPIVSVLLVCVYVCWVEMSCLCSKLSNYSSNYFSLFINTLFLFLRKYILLILHNNFTALFTPLLLACNLCVNQSMKSLVVSSRPERVFIAGSTHTHCIPIVEEISVLWRADPQKGSSISADMYLKY